jgi:hypothetical protein
VLHSVVIRFPHLLEFAAVLLPEKAGQMAAVKVMQKQGINPNTFYRRVKEYEHDPN